MKRIKADDTPRKRKPLARIRCEDRKPGGLKRVRVSVPPEQIEADEFIQHHLAKINAAKDIERTSWAAIADYLANTAPADLE